MERQDSYKAQYSNVLQQSSVLHMKGLAQDVTMACCLYKLFHIEEEAVQSAELCFAVQ